MGADFRLPAFMREDYALPWMMMVQEQAALVQLLDFVRPPVALEIGTNRGGSLQVIAPRAGRVYAVDINPRVPEWLGKAFPNVTFRIGDSASVLPATVREIEARGDELGFVLIDGDHTGEGVRKDVNAVLSYTPRRPVYVVLHDSFNPECRGGMLAAEWQACPHVHYLQLDFVRGKFGPCAGKFEMWGGFGLALLLPEPRTGDLTIRQDGWEMVQVLHELASRAPAAAAGPGPGGALHHLKGLCRALPGLPSRLLKRLRKGGAREAA
jgi:hypothetical protein